MSIGLSISISLFLIFIIVPSINWKDDDAVYKMTEVVLDYNAPEIMSPKFQAKPSKPDGQESQNKSKTEKTIKTGDQPKVVKEDQVEPVKAQNSDRIDSAEKEVKNKVINQDSLKGIGNAEGEGDLPFDFVDVMPQFPGGQRSLARFISSKLLYPGSALQNKIEGIVIVGFVIDKNGRLRSPKILKSLYPACDDEALRVVRLIPDWIPAKNQGRNVSINFTMPIEFKLIR
jgi:TonB family protein